MLYSLGFTLAVVRFYRFSIVYFYTVKHGQAYSVGGVHTNFVDRLTDWFS